jgi:hypothetical protein
VVAFGTDMKCNPVGDRHNSCADFPCGLLGAYLLRAPIGAGAIKSLAAVFGLAAHATTTRAGKLVVKMFFVVML